MIFLRNLSRQCDKSGRVEHEHISADPSSTVRLLSAKRTPFYKLRQTIFDDKDRSQ